VKAHISIHSLEELEGEAANAIEIYEDAPDGASPEYDDDPHLVEDGILVVGTDELEVEADFPLGDFPQELSFPVTFIGWDETEERMAAAHGLETHLTITLIKKWQSKSGKNIALYGVAAVHGFKRRKPNIYLTFFCQGKKSFAMLNK
jgi:hypothetical protein